MNCAVSPRRFLAGLTPSNVSEAKLVRDSAMPRLSFDLEGAYPAITRTP